ncbi:hypothetical protein [Streptomyces sp. NPDC049813]|uniref:hypothetical protein n=1 Tax=Streptomyces sp. NPDC049813 TaxID=3365597 RepID=UPI0037B303BE
MLDIIATAVLLAELGVLIRYRLVRRRQERPSAWPSPADYRYGHAAAALAAAATGWALAGKDASWGSVVGALFTGVIVPAAAALAATRLWSSPTAWAICLAGGFTSGMALS